MPVHCVKANAGAHGVLKPQSSLAKPPSLAEPPSVSKRPPLAEPPSVLKRTPLAEPPSVTKPTPLAELPSVSKPKPLAEPPSASKPTPLAEPPSVSKPTPVAEQLSPRLPLQPKPNGGLPQRADGIIVPSSHLLIPAPQVLSQARTWPQVQFHDLDVRPATAVNMANGELSGPAPGFKPLQPQGSVQNVVRGGWKPRLPRVSPGSAKSNRQMRAEILRKRRGPRGDFPSRVIPSLSPAHVHSWQRLRMW
jgi:hypothetical protein